MNRPLDNTPFFGIDFGLTLRAPVECSFRLISTDFETSGDGNGTGTLQKWNGWYLRCVKETYLWVVTIWWHSSFLFYDFSMICGYLSWWGNMDIKGVPLNFLTFKFTVRPWSNNLLSTRIILRNHMGESQISNSTETQTNPAVKNRL